MKGLLWTVVPGFVLVVVIVGILAWRGRRRRQVQDDVSPDWINENVYGRGKDGDDSWK